MENVLTRMVRGFTGIMPAFTKRSRWWLAGGDVGGIDIKIQFETSIR